MDKQYNVLQYEFFHVGGKSIRSSEDGIAKCFEQTTTNLARAIAGEDIRSGIKTVVRIYDIDGQVTHWVKQTKYLEAQREFYLNTPSSNIFTDWFVKWQIKQLNQGLNTARKSVVEYFTEYIDKSFNGEEGVAKETLDHAFRSAKQEEYIELQQSAIMSKGLWLFIFEPNDLLADENISVVHMM